MSSYHFHLISEQEQIRNEKRKPIDLSFGSNGKNGKWCPYHKTQLHDKSQCFTLNRNSNKSVDRGYGKGNGNNRQIISQDEPFSIDFKIIREPMTKIRELTLDVENSDFSTKALLDTGTYYTYISENLGNTVKAHNLNKSVTVEVANGEKILVKKVADLKVKIGGIKDTEYQMKTYVLPGMKNDMTIGMNFILQNKCILNLRDGILSVDGREFEIEGFKDNQNWIENAIID